MNSSRFAWSFGLFFLVIVLILVAAADTAVAYPGKMKEDGSRKKGRNAMDRSSEARGQRITAVRNDRGVDEDMRGRRSSRDPVSSNSSNSGSFWQQSAARKSTTNLLGDQSRPKKKAGKAAGQEDKKGARSKNRFRSGLDTIAEE